MRDAGAVLLHGGTDANGTIITRAGLERLSEELERLKTEGRQAVATRLEESAGGDPNPAENADYRDAREEQALLERRIALLEQRLRAAQLVEPRPGNGRVDVGERVRVRDLDSREVLEIELVGTLEADISTGRISVDSPLGRAIVGLRGGEVVRFEAPGGRRRFEIVAVEPPSPEAA